MPIRILEAPPAPWGDYGHILLHGMTDHLGRAEDGLLQLERTGPFVPSISFPGISTIVVRDDSRRQLADSGLIGFTFQPVHKAHIVELHWHTWKRDTDEPAQYPEDGEPENYILGHPHSAAVAAALPEMWELEVSVGAEIERVDTKSQPWNARIYLCQGSWSGADIFPASGVGYFFATDRAQEWLTAIFPGQVAFRDCLLK